MGKGDIKPIIKQRPRRDYTGLALIWGSLLFLAVAGCSYLDSIRVSEHQHFLWLILIFF